MLHLLCQSNHFFEKHKFVIVRVELGADFFKPLGGAPVDWDKIRRLVLRGDLLDLGNGAGIEFILGDALLRSDATNRTSSNLG